jgi:hypothetical protein
MSLQLSLLAFLPKHPAIIMPYLCKISHFSLAANEL